MIIWLNQTVYTCLCVANCRIEIGIMTYVDSVMSLVTENRVEFLEKLQRVCSQIKASTTVQPLLSHPGQCKLVVGNWSMSCHQEGEVSVRNSDGTRVRN